MLSVAGEVGVGRRVAHLYGEAIVGHVEGLKLLRPDEPHGARLGVQDVDQLQGYVLNPGMRMELIILIQAMWVAVTVLGNEI